MPCVVAECDEPFVAFTEPPLKAPGPERHPADAIWHGAAKGYTRQYGQRARRKMFVRQTLSHAVVWSAGAVARHDGGGTASEPPPSESLVAMDSDLQLAVR